MRAHTTDLMNVARRQKQPPGRPRQLASQMGQQPNIQTSIQPTSVFPEQHTQQAGNLAAALAIPGRADLYNRNGMQGVSSSSPMIRRNIGTDYSQSLAAAMMAPQQIGLQHNAANARNQLQGELGREQEAIGWDRLRQQQQNSLLAAFASLYQPRG